MGLRAEVLLDTADVLGSATESGEVRLELGDVITMISNYRGTSEPAYLCDCGVDPPGDEFAAIADPNGNCVSFELGDVVTEIGAYRGSTDASGCADCPGSLRIAPPEKEKPRVAPSLKTKIKIKNRQTKE